VAPAWSGRRLIDVSGRRRTLMAFGAVLVVLGAMLAAALLTRSAPVRVPELHGLSRISLRARLSRTDLAVHVVRRYSSAPVGAVIGQRPRAGARADSGTRVTVTLSAGPPPVRVPRVVGFAAGDAENLVKQLGLQVRTRPVPAFGAAVGSVRAQHPSPQVSLRPGGTVTLSVAEAPRWRTVTMFSSRQSVPFQIHGRRWRLVYRMGYTETCTFIFFCSGPTARIDGPGPGGTVGSFSLNSGTDQSQTFDTGPGTYQVNVAPGGDAARWFVQVQDWY
jgi:hypothetical protein